MKLLIVDDEEHVRIAIKLLIKKNDYDIDQIFEADNGVKAEIIIKEQRPNIVLTDINMPHRNGLDLLNWIQQYSKDIQVVVISICSQFDYVQQVIRNGGIDYILKPINPKQLNQAMDKAIENYLNKIKERKLFQENTKYKKSFWVKKFSNVILDSEKYKLTNQEIQAAYNVSGNTLLRIGVLRIYNLRGMMKADYGSDYELLEFSLMNVCDEVMKTYNIEGITFFNQINIHEVIICMWTQIDKAYQCLNEIMKNVTEIFGLTFHMGISKICKYEKGLDHAYRQGVQAIQQRKIYDMNQSIYEFDDMDGHYQSCYSHIEVKLLSSIIANDKVLIEKYVKEAFEKFVEEKYDTEKMVVRFLEEYKVLKRKWILDMEQGRTEQKISELDLIHGYINGDERITAYTIKLLEKNIIEELQNLSKEINSLQVQSNDYIMEVKKYLDTFFNTHISLSELSNQFCVSKEHLSRSFKERIGISIIDYISRKKIEKAKILMTNEDLKLIDIAELVGYNDERYLSKVFKKYCGLSPNQFRKMKKSHKKMI